MEYFKHVPKTMHENLRFREWLYIKARRDVGLQKALKEACRHDILFWTNAFLWTYDPRLVQKKIPFITYPFQDEGILAIQSAVVDGKKVVIKKSRDMGASWQMMLVFDHFATFEENCTFFVMSRNKKMVDAPRDPFSLFWKVDEIHRMLPSWLRPRIEMTTVGERKQLEINYVETGSLMTGGATVKAAAVGGRCTAIGVDEFSRFEIVQATLVKSGLSDVSNCIVWPFTRSPMGIHHPSNELIEAANKGFVRCLNQHWSQHPVKARGLYHVERSTRKLTIVDKSYIFPDDYDFQLDGRFEYHSPWFDDYRNEKNNDREVSENLEFDDTMGGNQVFDPIRIAAYAAENVRPPDLEGDLVYDPDTGAPGDFMEKRGGDIKLWMPLDVHGKPARMNYVGAADISLGVGTTNSCFSAVRCDIGEKILEFVSCKLKPDHFATKCVAICRWLSTPIWQTLLGWEKQGPGETFGNQVAALGYYPVYENVTKIVGPQKRSPGVPARQIPGLLTTYESALYNGTFVNHSEEALKETLEFEHTPLGPRHKANRNRANDPSGATLNHGDRVIADVICEMLLRHRGGGAAKPKEVIRPGCLAYFMAERERSEARGKTLFPNWNRRFA